MRHFDDEKGLFLIEWEDNGKQKYVSRLNLRFADEDKEEFAFRLQVAHQNRLAYETLMVFIVVLYATHILQGRNMRIALMSVEDMPRLSEQEKESISARIGNKVLVRLKSGSLKNEMDLMDEVEDFYLRVNKKMEHDTLHPLSGTTTISILDDSVADELPAAAYEVIAPRDPPVPEMGIIRIVSNTHVPDVVDILNHTLLTANRDTLFCILQ